MPINVKVGKYTITKSSTLRQAIKDYNLILHTTMGTIDTTNYNCVDSEGVLGNNIIAANQKGGFIELAYNSKGSVKIDDNAFVEGKDKFILVPFVSITKITVKSNRNFLKNQEDIKVNIS